MSLLGITPDTATAPSSRSGKPTYQPLQLTADFSEVWSRITRLSGAENYLTWAQSIKDALDECNLGSFIQEDWRKLNNIDEDISYNELDRDTTRIMAEICFLFLATIEEHLKSRHQFHRTYPWTVWNDLRNTYFSTGASGLYRVVYKYDNVRFPASSSGSVYKDAQKMISDLQEVLGEALAMGVNLHQLTETQAVQVGILRILNRLPSNHFANYIDHTIRHLEEFKDVDEFMFDLLNWTERISLIRTQANNHRRDMAVSTNIRKRKKCGFCQRRGHTAEMCYFDNNNAHLRPTNWRSRTKEPVNVQTTVLPR